MKFVLLLICTIICSIYSENTPLVTIKLGKIAGYQKLSLEGKKFSAFEGIPFAQPPIGDLRFKEPIAALPWNGIWNATVLHSCFQRTFDSKIIGQEDCLYINVYVPRETINKEEKLNVIVHIHGGGFLTGSGHSYTIPNYLMDRNIIFVSFNYRLGFLGFLSTEDEVVPGNNGLKDQYLALKWVQDHIEDFGGNKNSVTLTGFSAGAAASHYHLISPVSNGLFHRGISHSGTALSEWALFKNPLKTTAKLAESVGCPTEITSQLVECLKERPALLLLKKEMNLYPNKLIALNFGPVIEKVGKNPFLTADPYNLILNGTTNNVPWIFSNTANDGLVPVSWFVNNLDNINKNWENFAPSLLLFDNLGNEAEWSKWANEIKEYYVGKNGNIDKKNYKAFVKMVTDRYYVTSSEISAHFHVLRQKSPIYYYIYNYKTTTSFTDLYTPDLQEEFKGVSHGDDILRLYGNVVPNAKPTVEERKMIKVLLDIITSFAQIGVPTIEGLDWKSIDSDDLTYLKINGPSDLSVVKERNISEVEFWKKYNRFNHFEEIKK